MGRSLGIHGPRAAGADPTGTGAWTAAERGAGAGAAPPGPGAPCPCEAHHARHAACWRWRSSLGA